MRGAGSIDLRLRDVALSPSSSARWKSSRAFSAFALARVNGSTRLADRRGGRVDAFARALQRALRGGECAARGGGGDGGARIGIGGLRLRGLQIALGLRHFHLRVRGIEIGERWPACTG